MTDRFYESHLKQLPQLEPLKICRFCVTESSSLQLIADVPDLSRLYKTLSNVELPFGLEYPLLVCSTCVFSMRQACQCLNMLHNADAFWKKYRVEAAASSVGTIRDPAEIKRVLVIPDVAIETESGDEIVPRPESIFLTCLEYPLPTTHLHNNGQIDVKDDSMSSNDQIDSWSNSEPETNKTIAQPKQRRQRKKTALLGSVVCEICFQDLDSVYNRHVTFHNRFFNCAHCGMGLKTKDSIIKHLQAAHINQEPGRQNNVKPFCTICQKGFLSHAHWRQHISHTHYTINKVTCPVCDKTFNCTLHYNHHKRIHFEKKFCCPHCPKSFSIKTNLKLHVNVHKADKPFLCDMCGLSTKHKQNMVRHILGVHANKKQKHPTKACCSVCKEKFGRFAAFRNHLNDHHAALAESMIKEYRSKLKRKCKVCKLNFDTLEQYREHNRTNAEKHAERNMTRRAYSERRRMLSDFNEKIPGSSYNTMRPYICDICKNSFNSEKVLKAHIANHSKEPRPFKCEICGATYRRLSDMSLHTKRVHTGERPFGCDRCEYRCLTRPELNSHYKYKHRIGKQ